MKFNLEQLTRKLHEELPLLQQKFSVKSLAVFGSVARNDARPRDLDLLVDFYEPPGLFGFVALENHLADLLGIKIDLVMREALKPRLGNTILQEMVVV
jgi:predicted nucleotidyltransferase